MKAFVIRQAGGPEKLVLEELPQPIAAPGQVLIRVRAIGLNRSEWFTRRGDSPSVKFPRVLGIECVGEVVQAPGTDLQPGQRVAAMMGGMGREYDGSYAEYTLVPRAHVFALETTLDWARLGALPEMLQTTHGSLHVGLEIDRCARTASGGLATLLIRGGTSSIGLMALALAKRAGLAVTSTTRSASKIQLLKDLGADQVIVDDGSIADAVRDLHPGGVDRVLELVGATTLIDSLAATAPRGVVCMTGILGGQWVMNDFHPMGDIPTGVKLTSYSGGSDDITAVQLSEYVGWVEQGQLHLEQGPTFAFEDLPDAHRLMDENRANGKIVVMGPA